MKLYFGQAGICLDIKKEKKIKERFWSDFLEKSLLDSKNINLQKRLNNESLF